MICRGISDMFPPKPSVRTKIQDQPSNPPVPDMKDIPNASRPENAPANVAPPQKIARRVWIMFRGYHNVKLNSVINSCSARR